MKRLPLAVALAVAILSGGWFFRRAQSAHFGSEYTLSRSGTDVTVRRDPAAAIDIAERIAAELRNAGWTETPVSTGTFHLLTRGDDVVALVAEDLPSGGSRVTTLRKRRALR